MIKNIVEIKFITEYEDEGKELSYEIEKLLMDFYRVFEVSLKQTDVE